MLDTRPCFLSGLYQISKKKETKITVVFQFHVKKGEIWDPKEPTLEHKKIYMSTEKEDKEVSGVFAAIENNTDLGL